MRGADHLFDHSKFNLRKHRKTQGSDVPFASI